MNFYDQFIHFLIANTLYSSAHLTGLIDKTLHISIILYASTNRGNLYQYTYVHRYYIKGRILITFINKIACRKGFPIHIIYRIESFVVNVIHKHFILFYSKPVSNIVCPVFVPSVAPQLRKQPPFRLVFTSHETAK